eukprot:gb/GEZN01000475.1/.p1 GENE.gb/GEZN01000475.1/~~gb/GEZN01000475.1/.p1  ORF type:complete len:1229 (-),score=306.56 gb/GEZN01000475.1/:505-4191(-)
MSKTTASVNQPTNVHEQMAMQPTLNLGVIGHVSHGKSTLTRALSGTNTGRHREEQKRNMTIQLGYANFKIFRCCGSEEHNPCPPPECYSSGPSGNPHTPNPLCTVCDGPTQLVRHVSLVDSPGHHALMATMLSGASVMDGCLLVVAANEVCPCPQTVEHLAAADLFGISKYLLVVQNKVDLCTPTDCLRNRAEIQAFVNPPTQTQTSSSSSSSSSSRKHKPEEVEAAFESETCVVPVAANHKANLDLLCQEIVRTFPVRTAQHANIHSARFQVVRSFDVNQPGRPLFASYQNKGKAGRYGLMGGVVGGSLLQGGLTVGEELELRPGLVRLTTSAAGRSVSWQPLRARVVSLRSGDQDLGRAVPGGLLAVGLTLDPALCKANRLVGQTAGPPGTLPPVFQHARVHYQVLSGVESLSSSLSPSVLDGTTPSDTQSIDKGKTHSKNKAKKKHKRPQVGERLRISVGASLVLADIVKVEAKNKVLELLFSLPVCAALNSTFALLRENSQGHWRLLGRGTLVNLMAMEPLYDKPDQQQQQQPTPSSKASASSAGATSGVSAVEPGRPSQLLADLAKDSPQQVAEQQDAKQALEASGEAGGEGERARDGAGGKGEGEEMDLAGGKKRKKKKKNRSHQEQKAKEEEEGRHNKEPGSPSSNRSGGGAKQEQEEEDEQDTKAGVRIPFPEGKMRDDTASQMQEQAEEAGGGARMYANEWPQVGELVVAVPTRQDPGVGVFCRLPEYGDKHALVAAAELSRGKSRNRGGKLMALGKDHIALVLRVDATTGYIDISRKRVKPEEEAQHRKMYGDAKLVDSTLRHVASQHLKAALHRQTSEGQGAAADASEGLGAADDEVHRLAEELLLVRLRSLLVWPLSRAGWSPIQAFRKLLLLPSEDLAETKEQDNKDPTNPVATTTSRLASEQEDVEFGVSFSQRLHAFFAREVGPDCPAASSRGFEKALLDVPPHSLREQHTKTRNAHGKSSKQQNTRTGTQLGVLLLHDLEEAMRHRLLQRDAAKKKQDKKTAGKEKDVATMLLHTQQRLDLDSAYNPVRLVFRATCFGPLGVEGLTQAFSLAREAAAYALPGCSQPNLTHSNNPSLLPQLPSNNLKLVTEEHRRAEVSEKEAQEAEEAVLYQLEVQVEACASPRYVLSLQVHLDLNSQAPQPKHARESTPLAVTLQPLQPRKIRKLKLLALTAFIRTLDTTLEQSGGELLIDGTCFEGQQGCSANAFLATLA